MTLRTLSLVALFSLLASCGKSSPSHSEGGAGSPQAGAGGGGGSEPVELPFCGIAGISKGPWVLSVDSTSAVVRWETCSQQPTNLTYGLENGALDQQVQGTSSSHEILTETKAILSSRGADLAGTWWLHEVKLQNLTPSSCYTFRAANERQGRLCAARKSGDPLRFTFIADTNPGLSDKAANSLLARIEAFKPDLSLHGGDLQYYSSGLEPYSWWFEAMAPQFRVAPVWPAVGNHESEKPNEFKDYFERFWGGIGLDNQDYVYHFENAGVHFFALNTEIDLKPGSPQFAWISEHLPKAKAQPGFRFSVVYMHRPLATCGDTHDLEVERNALLPLFKENKVRLVLAGHMHAYERFDLEGIPFVVAGGGASLPGDVDENSKLDICKLRKKSGVFYHAVYVTVENNKLTYSVVDSKEQEQDKLVLDL